MYPYIIARKPKRKKTNMKFVFQTPLKETSVNLQYNKKEKKLSHIIAFYKCCDQVYCNVLNKNT